MICSNHVSLVPFDQGLSNHGDQGLSNHGDQGLSNHGDQGLSNHGDQTLAALRWAQCTTYPHRRYWTGQLSALTASTNWITTSVPTDNLIFLTLYKLIYGVKNLKLSIVRSFLDDQSSIKHGFSACHTAVQTRLVRSLCAHSFWAGTQRSN